MKLPIGNEPAYNELIALRKRDADMSSVVRCFVRLRAGICLIQIKKKSLYFQKQIITSRLMEISMKVDEYVYNCKPITNPEAEQFIKEVESYKVSCIRDERSLQVPTDCTRIT